MIKTNDLKRARRIRSGKLTTISSNEQWRNYFYRAANARSLLTCQRLKQLHKCVSDTNQHYMSNDHFLTTRFTLCQIQVLLDISEKNFNGPPPPIPPDMLQVRQMSSVREQVFCSATFWCGIIFNYRQLSYAV